VKSVVIVDYGMSNLDSVRRAFEECGASVVLTGVPQELARAARLVLPGVGAFPEGIRNLKERRLDVALHEQVIGRQVPFLGICLGMQMLASTGVEGTPTSGLGWIEGAVTRVEATAEDRHLPHIGWNEVLLRRTSPLFADIHSGTDFYFVHGYRLQPEHDEDIVGWTAYGTGFASAIQRQSIFGVQFHPEKSQRTGLQLIRNFLSI
jgi:glutamine amidotransferase